MRSRRPDPLLAVCVVALLAFPFAARVAASRQIDDGAGGGGRTPPAAVRATGEPGPTVRDLPAFTPGAAPRRGELTDRAALDGAVNDAIAAVFAPRDRAAIRRVLARRTLPAGATYPYRYPALEPLLRRADLHEANDLGALLVVAAAVAPGRPGSRQAAPVAFALLDRARAGGACLPQLNLAFLLATDRAATATAGELRRAARACGDDPTPLWVLGQLRSRDAAAGLAPRASFRDLQQRFPASPAGWAGAGDDELRRAYIAGEGRPFTAREHFDRARALYERALALRPGDPGLDAGLARADSGLRRDADAVAAQRRAVAREGDLTPLQARYVEYLERAHDFATAARATARVRRDGFPAGPALYAAPAAEFSEAISGEEADGPLSIGAGRLLPVSLAWVPNRPNVVAAGQATALSDFSFIPAYRPVAGVTDYDRWCPGWSRRRDLVLAHDARAALAGLPSSFADVRPLSTHETCMDAGHLRAVAELETRRRPASDGRAQEWRQDLWRFAGDLPRARAAVAQWAKAAPRDPRPVDRAGEIAFLSERYDDAARLFAKAVRLARARHGTWSLDEAEALAKRGAALELARRYDEAQVALADADEVATRVAGLQRHSRDENARDRAAFLAYSARAQAGDTFLRTHDFAAADEQYEAAREEESTLRACDCTPGRRPEVLDNNEALAQLRLHADRDALTAARAAHAADPADPIFLQTLALAQDQEGRRDAAVRSYRAAIASDPGLYPAANELGIALARRQRYAQAADAFRAAIAAKHDYAAGWFNLAIALERDGLGHPLSSQGSFARAFAIDDGLRDRRHEFISDGRITFARLDLSKPLPPDWSFAAAQDRAPATAAGFALALLLALRIGRGLMTKGAGENARKYLAMLGDRLSALPGTTPALVAVVMTIAVLAWPTVHGAASVESVLLLVLGSLALMAIVWRSRLLAARRAGVHLRQRGWTPGIAAAAGATLFGVGWAPLPVATTEHDARVVHWIGPLVAAVMGIALLALGAWLAVPATTTTGTIALVMAASLLVPIKPLDGGFLGEGATAIITNVLLVVVSALVIFGV